VCVYIYICVCVWNPGNGPLDFFEPQYFRRQALYCDCLLYSIYGGNCVRTTASVNRLFLEAVVFGVCLHKLNFRRQTNVPALVNAWLFWRRSNLVAASVKFWVVSRKINPVVGACPYVSRDKKAAK